MRDLEICVVRRDSLKDLYRARIRVDCVHPLELGLTFAQFQPELDPDDAFPAAEGRSSGESNPSPRLPPARASPPEKDGGSPNHPPNASFAEPDAALYPPEGTVFFIIAADTIIRGIPSDADDHVAFLLQKGDFEAAYRYALRHPLRRHSFKDIFRQLLESYMANDQLDKVAVLLPSFIGDNLSEWERWIYCFDQRGESWKLVDVVPNYTFDDGEPLSRPPKAIAHYHSLQDLAIAESVAASDDSREAAGGADPPAVVPLAASLRSSIGKAYYDLILIRCLERDSVLFNGAVHHFHGLFNLPIVLRAAEIQYEGACEQKAGEAASPRHTRALGEAYAFLLQHQGRDGEALRVLLRVSHGDEVVRFIREAKVFPTALEILPELFSRGVEATVGLLLDHARALHGVAGEDALGPEAVVGRLAGCERRFLWLYLHALRESNPPAFAAVAKRHAQLIATLYIAFDRAELLPFLREMCMYVERVKDICALCKKYHLLEEMVFLMARIGRGEEGLRVIVKQMYNIQKAVQFIVEVPSKEDQTVLFRRLVELVVEYNASLPVNAAGQRYILHDCQPEDTYTTIARQYDIDVDILRRANRPPDDPPVDSIIAHPAANSNPTMANRKEGDLPYAGIDSTNAVAPPLTSNRDITSQDRTNQEVVPTNEEESLPPNPCMVPLELLSALLRAAGDPEICANHPVIDAGYIIRKLPSSEYIADAGKSIAAVVRSRCENRDFISSVLQITMADLIGYHKELLTRQTAALTIQPGNRRCGFCREEAAKQGVVVFGCGHTYHPGCVLKYLAAEDVLNTELFKIDLDDFFARPKHYSKAPKDIPYCSLCAQSRGGLQR
ncbi:unnamed protein product [Phytomonas sp. Hart1]|nr:unnamed protein product [Phytomonas sp. Hart1]|eukprot:CCW68032.1 unnamed protein product [Phytomonas sp. isolate Hart1]